MHNPFPLLTPSLLLAQISEATGKKYFVRQTFPRGMQQGLKAAFLFRAYAADEKESARDHLRRLGHDPNAYLYDVGVAMDMDKLKVAARQPLGYKIYYVGKTKLTWRPPVVYQDKIKRYLQQVHNNWRTSRGKTQVMTGLYEEFGDIFLKFNFENEVDKIPFDEIEKY
jgi:hypothetical protein